MPGLISYNSDVSDDGEDVLVVRFDPLWLFADLLASPPGRRSAKGTATS
jgi:hypothetical protein